MITRADKIKEFAIKNAGKMAIGYSRHSNTKVTGIIVGYSYECIILDSASRQQLSIQQKDNYVLEDTAWSFNALKPFHTFFINFCVDVRLAYDTIKPIAPLANNDQPKLVSDVEKLKEENRNLKVKNAELTKKTFQLEKELEEFKRIEREKAGAKPTFGRFSNLEID